jgi:hypothetical protein
MTVVLIMLGVAGRPGVLSSYQIRQFNQVKAAIAAAS